MAGKLGRDSSARKAVLRDLVSSLILHEKINTTLTKAKETEIVFAQMVSLAKDGSLSARRRAAETLRNFKTESGQTILQKLFSEIAARYKERNGGYTRIYKLEQRQGDGAEMALIELV